MENQRDYKRNLVAGMIGAFFMMLGDLSLSLIVPSDADAGLFLREGYLNGGYASWRAVFLVLTGLVGVYGYWYGLKAIHDSVDDAYKETKKCFHYCSMMFCFTGLAIHFAIAAGAYITTYVSVNIGREEAIAMATDYANHILPAFYIAYLPMAFIFLYQLIMTVRGKTIYSRRMLIFSPLIWMGIFALVPDIRQMSGGSISVVDYVMTQCSGNAAPFLYFLACIILPDKFKYKENLLVMMRKQIKDI